MNPAAATAADLFINGALHPELWRQHRPIVCPVDRQTFAASRWKVRYAALSDGTVTQARSEDRPDTAPVACSLSLQGTSDVSETVFFGQHLEAAEAPRYRHPLVFSAWIFISGSGEAPIALHAGSPASPDVFTPLATSEVATATIRRGAWTRLELPFDARQFPATGLAVELAFPPTLFPTEIRVAQLQLLPITNHQSPITNHPALERQLAERFFQRHDSWRINSLGRALVVNAHELHFQFTFPEMRAAPACTLPHAEDGLRVFDFEGIPQSGFRYDVTYLARSSVILRATKENHGLRDGFLSFVGREAAILLDAEL